MGFPLAVIESVPWKVTRDRGGWGVEEGRETGPSSDLDGLGQAIRKMVPQPRDVYTGDGTQAKSVNMSGEKYPVQI